MTRYFGWTMLVAGVMFFTGIMSYHQKTEAFQDFVPVEKALEQSAKNDESQQPEAETASEGAEVIAQLKEINAQLKELKALLRSGEVRVTGVMNPDEVKPEEKPDGT
jgi:hypothetical protein